MNELENDDRPVPFRAIIYGEKGVGKSTFGLNAPNPVFIDVEKSTRALFDKKGNKAKVFKGVKTFTHVREKIQKLIDSPKEFDTLVIDSADWVEQVLQVEILGVTGKNINNVLGGYGAGRSEVEARFRNLLGQLDLLQEKHGMNVIFTAHSKVKTVKDPDAGQDYDAFEMKCDDRINALLQEWSDMVLFARFETFAKVDEAGKVKAATTGKHVMFTRKSAAYFAKNRYGLPPQLPVDYEAFAMALRKAQGETVEDVMAELKELYVKLDDETAARMKVAIDNAKGDRKQLVGIRNYARTKAAS
jgi:hypothetical protein